MLLYTAGEIIMTCLNGKIKGMKKKDRQVLREILRSAAGGPVWILLLLTQRDPVKLTDARQQWETKKCGAQVQVLVQVLVLVQVQVLPALSCRGSARAFSSSSSPGSCWLLSVWPRLQWP